MSLQNYMIEMKCFSWLLMERACSNLQRLIKNHLIPDMKLDVYLLQIKQKELFNGLPIELSVKSNVKHLSI